MTSQHAAVTEQFRSPLQDNRKHKASRYAGFIVAGILALAAPVAAQIAVPLTTPTTPTPTSARLIEWDITGFGDLVPGALAVDDRSSSKTSKVWFITRSGDRPQLYRFTPGLNWKHDHASAKSWDLGALLANGGLRLRHSDDGRYAFVNVDVEANTFQGALVAIDTKDDSRITWLDRPMFDQASDVAIDTRGGYATVYTAAPEYDAPSPAGGVVQQLKPGTAKLMNGAWVVPADVTRFPIGNGAGTCIDAPGGGFATPCIPGVAVDRRRGRPVYVAEPSYTNPDGSVTSAIAELDPTPVKCPSEPLATCAKVRHWLLPANLAAPRQIRVDDMGRIWGITSTGELFTLEINRSCDQATLTRHDPIGPMAEYLFAVAPAGGVVGFTDSNNNEVSVLFPESTPYPVYPKTVFIKPVKTTLYGKRECITAVPHDVAPRVATAQGKKYRNPGDGTYVETDVSTAVVEGTGSAMPSFQPTGMEANGNWRTGAFFYGVAFSGGTNRIGHIEVPIDKHKDMDCRKGDHDHDHDGIDDEDDNDVNGDGVPNTLDPDTDKDGVTDSIDTDKNGDGIDDVYQSRGNHETKRTDSRTMAPGETRDYEMEYDAHSVALLTIVEATNVLAPLSIQVLDDDGVVILSTPAALGRAIATAVPALPGVYTVRVKNAGTAPVTCKTTIIGKQVAY